jgi:hypothetical protein
VAGLSLKHEKKRIISLAVRTFKDQLPIYYSQPFPFSIDTSSVQYCSFYVSHSSKVIATGTWSMSKKKSTMILQNSEFSVIIELQYVSALLK